MMGFGNKIESFKTIKKYFNSQLYYYLKLNKFLHCITAAIKYFRDLFLFFDSHFFYFIINCLT